jgi:hypothetical protein
MYRIPYQDQFNKALEYVNKWIPEGVIYLSNNEIRAMINGGRGTESYAREMAEIFFQHTPGIPGTVDLLEQILYAYADGSEDNDEFWKSYDPFLWYNGAIGISGVRIYSNHCDGTCGTDFNMDEEGMTKMYELISGFTEVNGVRDPNGGFLPQYVYRNPDFYGGEPGGVPDLNHNPTWNTQDPN